MSVKLQCPHCQSKLVIRENNAGKRHRCPQCQQVITIAGPGSIAAATEPTVTPTPTPRTYPLYSRVRTLFKWVLISLTVCVVIIPMLLLSVVGVASLLSGNHQNPGPTNSGSESTNIAVTPPNDPVISTPMVDTAAREAAARNQNAWRQMDLCNNNNDRLSREAPLEYWEVMRQNYGEIDLRDVDWEFATLIEEYRSLFLEYANTHRQWIQERQPLVDALKGVEAPQSFTEGLVTGLAGGVAIGMIDDIDTRYRSRLTGFNPRMEELNQKATALRSEMTARHGVSM